MITALCHRPCAEDCHDQGITCGLSVKGLQGCHYHCITCGLPVPVKGIQGSHNHSPVHQTRGHQLKHFSLLGNLNVCMGDLNLAEWWFNCS